MTNKNLADAIALLEAGAPSLSAQAVDALRTVIEAARPKPVYLPTYVSWDGWHRSDDLTEDYGYFTSQEAAEAWVDGQNADLPAYNDYVRAVQAERDKYEAAYAAALAKWEDLAAKVPNPEDYLKKPKRPNFATPKTYEEWKLGREARFGWVEVVPHEVA